MEIALDLSSKSNLPCSMQIARSLEPYGIMYLEDPMLPDNLEGLCLAGAGDLHTRMHQRAAGHAFPVP